MDDRDRQAVGRGQGFCPAAPPLGGGAHPCLAEPQPPTGEGCRKNNRERGDLALYCQRQADVAPPGSRSPVDVRPLLSAISVSLCSDCDSSQTLNAASRSSATTSAGKRTLPRWSNILQRKSGMARSCTPFQAGAHVSLCH